MTIRIRLCAAYREAAGTGELELPASPGLTIAQLWGRLLARYPDLNRWPPWTAVNQTYADLKTALVAGDEVAFLPLVRGTATGGPQRPPPKPKRGERVP